MARQEEEDVEEDGEKAELWMEDDSKRIHPLLGKIKNKKNSKSQRSLSVGGSSAGDPEVLTAVSTTPVSVDEGVHLKLLVKSVVIGMCVCACVCVCVVIVCTKLSQKDRTKRRYQSTYVHTVMGPKLFLLPLCQPFFVGSSYKSCWGLV